VSPPKTAWTTRRSIPITAPTFTRRDARSRKANQVPSANMSISPPAQRRWICSQKTPPSMTGIHDPKQVGQSGHASDELVACTMLPSRSSESVHPTEIAKAR